MTKTENKAGDKPKCPYVKPRLEHFGKLTHSTLTSPSAPNGEDIDPDIQLWGDPS